MKEEKILKSAGKVGLATSLSRVFGYFRDASLALVLGAGFGMDAFTVAFRLANLFRRLVAEGAMSSAFVPVFVSYRKEQSEKKLWDFARRLFYTLALITGVIVIIEIVFAAVSVRIMAPGFSYASGKFDLTVQLTRMMAPYLLCAALAAFLMGVLNSLGHFIVPALSPVFFNVTVIVSAFTLARMTAEPAVGIAFGVLIGGGLQLASQIPIALKKGMNFAFGLSFRHPAIQKVGKLLVPSLLGIGVVQLNLLIDSLMASFLREGSVSHLYYADRVMELVLGVFVISLATVILPEMSKSAADQDHEQVKSTLLFSFRVIAFVAIPATVGLFLLSDPIVHVLFERGSFGILDTERTAVALSFYALGLCFISATRLVVSAYYATQDTKTPAKIAVVVLVANAILNWILMHPLKQGGIALATSIASVINFGLLIYFFERRFGVLNWSTIRRSLLKIGLSSFVMGIFCLLFLRWAGFDTSASIGWKALVLFGTIGGGLGIYLITSSILKVDELSTFKKYLTSRGKGK